MHLDVPPLRVFAGKINSGLGPSTLKVSAPLPESALSTSVTAIVGLVPSLQLPLTASKKAVLCVLVGWVVGGPEKNRKLKLSR